MLVNAFLCLIEKFLHLPEKTSFFMSHSLLCLSVSLFLSRRTFYSLLSLLGSHLQKPMFEKCIYVKNKMLLNHDGTCATQVAFLDVVSGCVFGVSLVCLVLCLVSCVLCRVSCASSFSASGSCRAFSATSLVPRLNLRTYQRVVHFVSC